MGAAVLSVALCAATYPAYASWVNSLPPDGQSSAVVAKAPDVTDPSQYVSADGHDHNHDDPATKNAVSRVKQTSATKDPTTAEQAAAAKAAVKAQRAEKDPTLVTAPAPPARTAVPADRYAMAGGCYALQDVASKKWVTRTGSTFAATGASVSSAVPLTFQASDLGTYLLYGKDTTFVTTSGGGAVQTAATPSAAAEWVVRKTSRGFTFTQPGTALAVTKGAVAQGTAAPFALRTTTGCAKYPEIQTNVKGGPFAGTSPFQEVRGYLDAHTHGMAFEFLGGDVHCGRPWHPYGVAYALQDCPDHKLANGAGAVLENFTRSGVPVGTHDPVGWPTFKDWPAPDSLTHEGTYYKWLERSWRGGQRILVNLLVENNQLCNLYPLKRNSCDDMTSLRLQADDMRKLERYVDAQSGGPGKGWYRIVTDPWQARKVINQGKLAVVMGIETSVLFGCSSKLDKPTCTSGQIDQQLDEVHAMGVRQMELVNKFDNGLAGVAGDSGGVAPLVNLANFLETGTFWNMQKCPAGADGVQDRTQLTAVPDAVPADVQDALFGAIAKLYLPIALPIYQSGPTCNTRGLTSLGDHTIERMAAKHMIFDPDHMSVNARKASLDVTEKLRYPGVVSSHSWSTPDAYPRIYKAGGVITPYAGDSTGFVDKWKQHLGWADPRYYFGFGYGADINGLGAQGNPRGADAKNKVTYPFKGLGGVTIDKNVSGQRVYDINTDGVAQYGLYPDWIEDLRRLGGQDIVDDMARGSEAYLQMWERAEGATTDACRDTSVRRSDTSLTRLAKKGTSVRDVVLKAGQPHQRLGTTFRYCAWKGTSRTVKRTVTVTFTKAGTVSKVV